MSPTGSTRLDEQRHLAAAGAPSRVGFRPGSRRRARVAVGAGLAAVAVGGNVLVYRALGDTTPVLQVVSPVRAGQVVTAGDVRVVEVDLDPTVPFVPATDLDRVVDQYARVHLVAGTLVVAEALQSTPLVTPGQAVVAIEIRGTRVPAGLRERSRVLVVVVDGDDPLQRFVTEGRVVARGSADDSSDLVALSVEVGASDVAKVAAATDVRVALLDPSSDPALAAGP
jgi:hypothetical protein